MEPFNFGVKKIPVEINGESYTITSDAKSRAEIGRISAEFQKAIAETADESEKAAAMIAATRNMIDIMLGKDSFKKIFAFCKKPSETDVTALLAYLTAAMREAAGNG